MSAAANDPAALPRVFESDAMNNAMVTSIRLDLARGDLRRAWESGGDAAQARRRLDEAIERYENARVDLGEDLEGGLSGQRGADAVLEVMEALLWCQQARLGERRLHRDELAAWTHAAHQHWREAREAEAGAAKVPGLLSRVLARFGSAAKGGRPRG